MKSYELKPTTENLFQTFVGDRIDRDRDIWSFCRILNNVEDSCSIAIDGAWGSGKTFFVKQVKMVLEAHNPFSICTEMNPTQIENIQNTWKVLCGQNTIELQPQVCVYYDAWENDNDSDPVLSLVYSILRTADTNHKFSENSTALTKAAAILDCFSGKNFSAAVESFMKNTILDELRSKKDVESNIKEFLDELLPERGNRLVVFVDELDRCKPTFAVQLLERIKHYFDNDRITFVFSINANELEHTIKKHYGNGFDSGRYLDRFFDLRMSLPAPNMDKFFHSIGFDISSYWYDICSRAFIEANDLSMREIARYIHSINIAASKYLRDRSFYDDSGVQKAMMTVLPVLIGLKVINANQYEMFISGQNVKPLIDVAQRVPEGCFGFLLSSKEYYSGTQPTENSKVVEVQLEERVTQYYNLLFCSNAKDAKYGYIQSGSIHFESHVPDTLLRAASFLSAYTDLDA